MPLKVTRRHGSPYWYLRGAVRGISVDESTGTSDRSAAEQIRIKREAELLTRSIHGDSATRTFAEAALSYIDSGGDAVLVEPIAAHFGDKTRVADVGQHEIEECAKKLYPNGTASTRNRKVYTPISAILNHAARKKWCPKPVIARPKGHDKERVRWITPAEAERLIEAASEHMRPLVIFLLSTGCRLAEALYLEWDDVDLSRAHVSFRETDARGIKTGESRGVPLPARAVAALASLPWDREGFVFRKPMGRTTLTGKSKTKLKLTGRRWEPYASRNGEGGGQVKTGWAGMCRRAKIADFTPHDCRHTWATWHYIQNRDVGALMQLGGWKTPSMVFRYTHVNAAHLAPSQAKIWGLTGHKPGEQADAESANEVKEQAK